MGIHPDCFSSKVRDDVWAAHLIFPVLLLPVLDSIEEQRPDLTSSVLFHGVIYLGSTSTTSPRSEEELLKYIRRTASILSISLNFFRRNMTIINEQSQMAIEVTLCVPDNADGRVR